MKVCPKCKRTWPDTGRFCPMDGTALVPQVDEEAPTVDLSPKDAPQSKVAQPQASVKPAPKKAPDASPRPEPRPGPGPASGATGSASKKKREFSETKWFMLGDVIEEKDLDPEIVPTDKLREQYRPTTELPPEVRKKFSLSYGQEADKDEKKK